MPADACDRQHLVAEHAREMQAHGLIPFLANQAKPAKMPLVVSRGDEFRQRRLIDDRRVAIRHGSGVDDASTSESGTTQNPRRSDANTVLLKVPT